MTHPETQEVLAYDSLSTFPQSSGNLSCLLQVGTQHGAAMSVTTWSRADEDEF